MKTFAFTLLIALTSLTVNGALRPPDLPFRSIGGVRVDLTPLYEWMNTPVTKEVKPPRPLPNWHTIRVETVIRAEADGVIATASGISYEGGKAKLFNQTIFFRNLPGDFDPREHRRTNGARGKFSHLHMLALKVQAKHATTLLNKKLDLPIYDHGIPIR